MTTEEWRPILGYETSYEVSNLGRVRSIDKRVAVRNGFRTRKGKLIKSKVNHGYHYLNISKDNKPVTLKVARLVLTAFHGEGIGLQACHKNGNSLDDKLSNLCWGTPSENNLHKLVHGTMLCGEKHPFTTLSTKEVLEIRYLRTKGAIQEDLAERFNVSRSCISSIVNRKTWKHV